MKFVSPAFENHGKIPAKYTCTGDNINPPFRISEVLKETVSFVLIMDDPDVPKSVREDGMWDHWLIYNMPAHLREIQEGKEPKGSYGIGTSGFQGYYGPCPSDGEHRYFFKLYALNKMLELPEQPSKQQLIAAMHDCVIDHALIIGHYCK